MEDVAPSRENAPQRRARKPELSALMSLRFVAAVGVFLLHVSNVTGATLHPGRTIEQWPSWLQVLHEGYYRQTFFLMLSGFVLVYVYGERLRSRPDGFTRGFLVRRLARIWPLHVLMLLVMIPGAIDDFLLQPLRVAAAFLANGLLLQGWFPLVPATEHANIPNAFNGPSWALSSELFAYVVFPVFGAWLIQRVGSAGRAVVAAAAIWLAVLALGLAATALDERQTAVELVYTLPAARLLDFVVGMLLGVAFAGWLAHRAQAPGGAVWGSGGRSWRWTGGEITVVALLVTAIALRDLAPHQVRLVAWYMPVMAAVIVVFAFGRGRLSSGLSRRPLVALGRVSFAFYICHFPILVYAQVLFGFSGATASGVAMLFAVSLAAAFVLNRLVENPAREAIVQWHDGRRAARVAEPAAPAGEEDDVDSRDEDEAAPRVA